MAVPGLALVRKIFPEDGSVLASVAWTWMLLIVTLSSPLAPLTLMSSVIVVELTVIPLIVTSWLLSVAVPTPGLKRQPDGALRIKVAWVWPLAKSPDPVSARTMFPKVVQAGEE